jgi:phage gpG-like protein
MKIKLTGPWKRTSVALRTAESRLKKLSERLLLKEAQYLRKKIVQGIRKQAPGGKAFVPLKRTTIERRQRGGFGGTKALIVTGDMRNAIKVSKLNNGAVFVGILRSARSKGGSILVNIAAIHEYGAPKAKIPARPFMRPTFEAEKKAIQERFGKALFDGMKNFLPGGI